MKVFRVCSEPSEPEWRIHEFLTDAYPQAIRTGSVRLTPGVEGNDNYMQGKQRGACWHRFRREL